MLIVVFGADASNKKHSVANIELVRFEQDTLSDEDSLSPVVIMETIVANADSFHYRLWLLYADTYDSGGYLGADGCMPSIRVDGVVRIMRDTLICQGEIKGSLFIVVKDGKVNKNFDARLIKYDIDHKLQEYWCDIKSGKFYLNKLYKRR